MTDSSDLDMDADEPTKWTEEDDAKSCRRYRKMVKDGDVLRDAAHDFLNDCGLEPNPDAIGQLAEAFLPCLQIICERGYVDPDNPEEHFWLARGWKGIVHDIMDNALRLKFFSWKRNEFYPNGALDIINFAGFYLRAGNQGKKWGEIGEPG